MVKRLTSLLSKEELRSFIGSLRIFASNNKFDKKTIEIVEKTIEKCLIIEDKNLLLTYMNLKSLKLSI